VPLPGCESAAHERDPIAVIAFNCFKTIKPASAGGWRSSLAGQSFQIGGKLPSPGISTVWLFFSYLSGMGQ
jgi:hypothetical protein